MKVKVEVFTSPTCPHCPAAIRLARSVEGRIPDVIKVVETSSGTHFGFQRMKKFNIMATPTIIISGPAIHDKIGFRGTPSRDKFLKAISEASGIPFDEIRNRVNGANAQSEHTEEDSEKKSAEEKVNEKDSEQNTGEKKRGLISKLLSIFKKR